MRRARADRLSAQQAEAKAVETERARAREERQKRDQRAHEVCVAVTRHSLLGEK